MSDEPVITCKNLDCGYDAETVILHDVNLEVKRGEILALLGGSGSGKSTLLKTMVGLLPPLSGEIRLFGHDMYSMTQVEKRSILRRIGMLFQYGALFGSMTNMDNVALPIRQHTTLPDDVVQEMVRQRLGLVGLKGLEHRMPADVSGGQRKRVALARASILDPEVVFCDEPSAGLDPVVAAGLDQTLRRFQRLFKMTMVVITHELESIKTLADRVVMLADSKIQAVGTVEELTKSDIKPVHDFFHRVPTDYAEEGETVLESLEIDR